MVIGLFSSQQSPLPESIKGVRVRQSPRARRLSLTVDLRQGDIVLVMPKRASLRAAENFVDQNQKWIARQRSDLSPRSPLCPGATLPYLGQDCLLERGSARGLITLQDNRLIVPGAPEHFERRLRDFLKARARETLTNRALQKAKSLGVRITHIRIGDPATRWGSCTQDGTQPDTARLSFSWRLILTPDWVLDYVVAHEVAHIIHMNHGKDFWRLCDSLTTDGKAARRWLKNFAQDLHRY